ncbi:MAG: glycerophosphodiester phosphodiesterase [Granulosicoccus sp.]
MESVTCGGPTPSRAPRIYAHRGSMLMAPENTAQAFDFAVSAGADVLETDVRLSRDGVVVVTHDAKLDRTTNGQGLVRNWNMRDMAKLSACCNFVDLKGQSYRGVHAGLMTLDELFVRYPGIGINIDIKDPEPAAAKAVAAVVERHADNADVTIGSFHAPTLRQFREMAPQISTAAVQSEVAALWFGRFLSAEKTFPKKLPYNYLQIPTRYRGIPLSTPAFIKTVHALNIKTVYWTINKTSHMQTLVDRGAAGIVTDRPDLAAKLIGRRKL